MSPALLNFSYEAVEDEVIEKTIFDILLKRLNND
jgi:hypothetical protein